MQRLRHIFGAAAVAAGLCLPGVTLAQEAGDAASAEALFRQGRAAADHADYATAYAKFRESNRLDPAVGTVFNIADCEEHLGKLATAWTHFQEVVQRLPPSDPRNVMSAQRAAALEKRVPRLLVKLVGPVPPQTVVRRNNVELGPASLGSSLPVDPGDYAVVVTAPGTEEATYSIHVGVAESRTLEVSHGKPLEKGHGTGAAASGDGKRTAGWIVGGVGVAGLAVGAVTGVMVLGKKSAADADCPNQICNRDGYDAVESGRTLGTVSTVGFVVGALGVGVGGWLLLSSGGEAGGETAVGASANATGGSLSLLRRF